MIGVSALLVLFGQLIWAFLGDWSDLGLKFRISASNQYPIVIGFVALLAAALTADHSKVGSTITNNSNSLVLTFGRCAPQVQIVVHPAEQCFHVLATHILTQ